MSFISGSEQKQQNSVLSVDKGNDEIKMLQTGL